MRCNCLYLWPDFWKLPHNYPHNGKEWFSSSIDCSINKLNIYQNTTPNSWHSVLFLKLVSEACQMSMSNRMSIDHCHWLACIGSHLAGNHLWAHWRYTSWIYLYFVTFWVKWGLSLGHFTLKIVELSATLWLVTTPIYIAKSFWCWSMNYLKVAENLAS